VKELILPKEFAGLLQAQIDLMNYESYRSLASDRVHHWDGLSETLRKLLDAAGKVTPARYDEARALAAACRAKLGDLFDDAEVILAPVAPGEAPHGLGATGDPVFCRIWTLLGVPAMSIPCSQGPNGLPVGVQVIGRVGYDAPRTRGRRVAAGEAGYQALGTDDVADGRHYGREPRHAARVEHQDRREGDFDHHRGERTTE
jgi:Asp-tRNA(Asn)/Glu-tRNA(Gln) amidotransferase A subunit family amidase